MAATSSCLDHRVFSNLKTWALGVYHRLRRKHLQAYLNEFTFRFNRRRTRTPLPIAARHRLQLTPATYQMLIFHVYGVKPSSSRRSASA